MPFDGTGMPETGRAPDRTTAYYSALMADLLDAGRPGAAAEVWVGALCAQTDPDLFFPAIGQPVAPAKAICAACPVRVTCLDVFGDLVHDGVVGGLSARERRARRVARRNGAAA